MHLNSIDQLKGLLIILVIIGHVLQGPLSENIFRYAIYSFHMPLFIGLSGFLLNIYKIKELTLAKLINKYIFRIIIPSIIGLFVYFLIIHKDYLNSIDILDSLSNSFTKPYYHLWFVPAFLSWVFITWLFAKINSSKILLLSISIIITVIAVFIDNYPYLFPGYYQNQKIIEILLNMFRPYFYVFFVFGVICKDLKFRKLIFIDYLLPIILFAYTLYLFYNPNLLQAITLSFVFNVSLLNLCFKLIKFKQWPKLTLIEWMGKNSYGIYLWHVIPIICIKITIGLTNLNSFYYYNVFAQILLLLLIYILTKNAISKKYLLGLV